MAMVRLVVAGFLLGEVASLIVAGRAIGVLPALLLVVAAALGGAALLRRQGTEALGRLRGALDGRRDPRPALLRGGFRVAAGLLLILPGFLSDLLALLLVLPPVQAALGRALARRGLRAADSRGAFAERPPHPAPRPQVEEAEWEELPPKRPTHRPSGWTRH